MSRRWRIVSIIVAVAAAVALAWWWFGRDRDPAARYELQTVETGRLVEAISANGTINPVVVVNVGVQVSGTVETLHADFNDRVNAGQLLLELDPRLFRARLAQSEASLANVRAQAALATANARRAAELRRQDFISQQDFDAAVAQQRTSAAQVASAEAAVAQDRANLAFSSVRAPVSGVVISRQVDVGQTVAASFQTPTLFVIAQDLRQMQIEAAVAEADIARIREGQVVRFTVDAFGPRMFEGEVRQIRLNPIVQQNVVTFTVVVAVNNEDGALLPGMTANAEFLVQEYADALLVPNAALSWKPEDWVPEPPPRTEGAPLPGTPVTVFVLGENGQPEARRIRIGASDAMTSVVLGGELRSGEQVIIGTPSRVQRGQR
ncbi:MAG: efflux RND transporter periplasmic adaptor subunit [Thermaurantiacus sp.]